VGAHQPRPERLRRQHLGGSAPARHPQALAAAQVAEVSAQQVTTPIRHTPAHAIMCQAVPAFRFRIVEQLGKGATGTVFAAEDLWSGGEKVALKVLSAEDAPVVASLRAEFGLLAA